MHRIREARFFPTRRRRVGSRDHVRDQPGARRGSMGIRGNRSLRVVGVLTSVVLLAALATPALFAQAKPTALGSSPFQITTNAPDLRTASLAAGGRVRLCYDENISNPGNANDYFVTGYDLGEGDPA